MIRLNMQIELSNHCNLSCIECPHSQMQRNRQYMSDEVFERVIDYIRGIRPNTIIPHKDGEPLLHPNFLNYLLRMMDSSPTSKIDIYTNAHFLTPNFFHAFLRKTEGRQNQVVFLVTFHRHDRHGKPYDLTTPMENISYALDQLKPMTNRRIEFVLTSHKTNLVDQADMDSWYKYWSTQKKTNRYISDVHANTAINPWAERIDMEGLVSFETCPYRDGVHFFIGVTGNVIPCCIDLEEEVVFGNITEDPFEIIMGKRDRFYQEIITKSNYEVCQKCLTR